MLRLRPSAIAPSNDEVSELESRGIAAGTRPSASSSPGAQVAQARPVVDLATSLLDRAGAQRDGMAASNWESVGYFYCMAADVRRRCRRSLRGCTTVSVKPEMCRIWY
jgi:hypothetical protein